VDEEMWTRGMAMRIAMEVQEMWMWMRRCGRGAWRMDSDGGAGDVDVDEEMWTRGMAMWIAMEVQEMWMREHRVKLTIRWPES